MTPLNDGEKALLRDLSRNPTFASICQKVGAHKTVPAYKKGTDMEQQSGRWIYDSGWVDGVAFTLNVLGYKHE